MKEALIIFIVGLILGTNFAHGTTAHAVKAKPVKCALHLVHGAR